jgi:putative FmdB family regulatory protein
MPVYEYQCKACDHEFEREQRISEKPVKKCPKCGSMQARRLISRTSFVLKGSGWYNDLYASSKPKADAEKSTDTSDAKAETKAETKAEPAGDAKGGSAGESKDKGDKPAAKAPSPKGGGKGGAKGAKAAA